MGSEVEHHLLLTTSKNPRVGEGGQTRDDLDGASSGVIETTPLEEPSIDVPGPARDRAVYNCSPEPDEDHHGYQSTALGDGTNDNRSGDGAELHLDKSVSKRAMRRGSSRS